MSDGRYNGKSRGMGLPVVLLIIEAERAVSSEVNRVVLSNASNWS